MDITLGMGVDENRVKWVLKLNNHIMESIKQVKIGLIFNKLVQKVGVITNLKLTLLYFT